MYLAVVILIIIVCVFLVLVILSQSSKGGASQVLGGSGSSQLLGVQRTSELLEKITWGLAISLLLLCLSTNFLIDRPGQDGEAQFESVNVEKAKSAPAAAPAQQTAPAPAEEAK